MKLKLLIVALFCSVLGWGQVSMSTTGSYSQNFDGLINTGSTTWTNNSTIAYWYSQRSGTGTTITSGTGSANSGDLYSFGSASGNTERALGSVGTSNAAAGNFAHGMLLRNTSGTVITDIKVSYKMEQWRNSAAAAQTISFYYKISSASFTALDPNITTGWTAVTALNANSPITGGTAGALNGNLGANQVSLSGIAIPSLSLAAGDYIMIKWDDPDHSGNDHGLSIDDVIVDWTVTPATCATPTIGTNPSTTIQNLCVGASATALTVAATGSPTLTYQWYSNSVNSNSGGTLIAGATSSSYTPSTATAGTLYYYCEVGSTCLPTPTPAVSNVSGAVNVTAIPSAPAGTINVSANPSCGAATLTYSAPSATIYWQTTAGGTLTTNPTTSSYTSSATAGTYTVYVRELSGTCWSTATSVTFTVVAPVNITGQPNNQATTTGNTASFSVTASNAAGYQWQVNTGSGWANIGGATSASYTTPAATLAMNGYQYQVIITGNAPCGNVTSSAATLSVTNGPCFSEDFSSISSGNSTGTSGSSTAWTGNANFSTVNTAYQAGGAVRIGSGSASGSITSSALASVSGNVTVSIAVKGWTTVEGDLVVTLNGVNQTLTYTAVMGGSFETVSANFVGVPAGSTLKIETTAKRAFIDKVEAFCTVIAGPEINVSGNAITIMDNDTNPSTADGTSFGSTVIGTPIIKTFTIHNQGTTNLVLSGPVTLTDVSAPQEFVISQPAITTIPAGGSTTFTVTFNSAVAGTFTNTINIGSNDTDEALYNFNIVATATNTPTTGGTVFNPGELIFVGYDGQINGGGGGAADEYLVATLVDIAPGTSFLIVNSRYEAGAAANVRTDKWGGGGDNAEEQPYQATITYTGAANIPAGSVLVFRTNGTINWFGNVDVITGVTTTNRTIDFSGSVLNGVFFSPNISTNDSDQMYLAQGAFTFDGTLDIGQANYYLSGTLLHGLTNRAAWVPITSACNGDASGGNSRESRLPAALTCFNVESASASAISGYYENDKEHGIATIRQIILGISDVSNNWTLSTGRYTLDATSSAANRAGKTFQIGPSNPSGQWVGNVDTNWFNCANWEGLAVPSFTTDVTIDATAMNIAVVDYTAPYSNEYSDIAYSNDLNITGSIVQIQASTNNVLEVHGNLQISGTGILDMDDSTVAADGQLYLFGNWTNIVGNTAFEEGNGTVYFTGTSPQIINNVTPEGTEIFHNVVLNNDFTTSVSNDIIATGNLTVNPTKTLVVSSNDYVQVTNNITNNGTLNVLNNGSLVQVNDLGVNAGNISYQRIASVKLQDYVYWSSPVSSFDVNSISPATPAYYHWEWNPTIVNPNGGEGNWVNASTTMLGGKGYIVRAPNGFSNSANQNWTATFNNGVPNNGVYTPTIERGTNLNAGTAGPNGVMRLATDDNWNLLGNPYPSSISINSFLASNPQLDGFIRLWTHGTLPSTAILDPFYDNFVSNYTAGDYIALNGSGATSGPGAPGVIGAGQGFFVLMNPGAATTSTALFNNAMRSKNYSNSHFYRNANARNTDLGDDVERHRIWLDLVSPTNETTRTLVAYVDGATAGKDRMFDAFTDYKLAQNFYSLIDDQVMAIQGKGLPFEQEDRVPLGVKIPSNGIYKIAIAAVDGLFESGQTIYLEDKSLGVIHDLRQNPYSFTGTSGILNDRFVLRYTNETLGNEDFENNSDVLIFSSDLINIQSFNQTIQSVTIHNVLGQLLVNQKNVNADTFEINTLQKNKAPLIIQVTLENGKKIAKKLIF